MISERQTLLFIFIICCTSVVAQDSVVQGKIVDDKTAEPIPFATVRIVKTGSLVAGVVSNRDGGFAIPSKVLGSADSLVISCIGYANERISVSSFIKNPSIKLREGSRLLNEVVVKAKRGPRLSADKIVELAIENIPRNYATQPFSYFAYYRDYQQENSEYVNLNEALINVFDQGFQTNDFDSTKITLYQYRQNNVFKRDSSAEVPYDNKSGKFIPTARMTAFGGNELSILRIHDAIRNYGTLSYSFVDEFDKGFLKNHAFKLIESIPSGDTFLYHISFQSKTAVTGPDHESTGEIFIEHGRYGISKLIYKTFRTEYEQKNLLYSAEVEYRREGDMLYLNYISFNNFFKTRTDQGFKVIDIVFDRDINAFIVSLNHPPDRVTAMNIGNYNLKFEGKPVRIDQVQLSNTDSKQIKLFVSSVNLVSSSSATASKFEAVFKNIKDEAGREINTDVFKQVSQFRELFLQKLTPQSNPSADGFFINKEAPLREAALDESGNQSEAAWMNTPLKKN